MPEKTDSQLKKEFDRLVADREAMREQARRRGCEFVALDDEQLMKKLRGETTHSPFFTAYSWDQFTKPGSESFFLLNYFNPDPTPHLCFVTFFIGLPFSADVSEDMKARDTRWPSFSTELQVVQPSEVGIADVKLRAPFVTRGTYFSNAVLWGWLFGDSTGTFFDRAGAFLNLQ